MTTTVMSDESPKFYEADGALRAFSNRAIIISVIACLVALIAVAGCFVARLQPRVLGQRGSPFVQPKNIGLHSAGT